MQPCTGGVHVMRVHPDLAGILNGQPAAFPADAWAGVGGLRMPSWAPLPGDYRPQQQRPPPPPHQRPLHHQRPAPLQPMHHAPHEPLGPPVGEILRTARCHGVQAQRGVAEAKEAAAEAVRLATVAAQRAEESERSLARCMQQICMLEVQFAEQGAAPGALQEAPAPAAAAEFSASCMPMPPPAPQLPAPAPLPPSPPSPPPPEGSPGAEAAAPADGGAADALPWRAPVYDECSDDSDGTPPDLVSHAPEDPGTSPSARAASEGASLEPPSPPAPPVPGAAAPGVAHSPGTPPTPPAGMPLPPPIATAGAASRTGLIEREVKREAKCRQALVRQCFQGLAELRRRQDREQRHSRRVLIDGEQEARRRQVRAEQTRREALVLLRSELARSLRERADVADEEQAARDALVARRSAAQVRVERIVKGREEARLLDRAVAVAKGRVRGLPCPAAAGPPEEDCSEDGLSEESLELPAAARRVRELLDAYADAELRRQQGAGGKGKGRVLRQDRDFSDRAWPDIEAILQQLSVPPEQAAFSPWAVLEASPHWADIEMLLHIGGVQPPFQPPLPGSVKWWRKVSKLLGKDTPRNTKDWMTAAKSIYLMLLRGAMQNCERSPESAVRAIQQLEELQGLMPELSAGVLFVRGHTLCYLDMLAEACCCFSLSLLLGVVAEKQIGAKRFREIAQVDTNLTTFVGDSLLIHPAITCATLGVLRLKISLQMTATTPPGEVPPRAGEAAGLLRCAVAYAEPTVTTGLRTQLARALALEGHPDMAVQQYQLAVSDWAEHPEAAEPQAGGVVLLGLGNAYLAAGQPELAIQTYHRALDLADKVEPESSRVLETANVHFLLGEAFENMGKWSSARAAYQEVASRVLAGQLPTCEMGSRLQRRLKRVGSNRRQEVDRDLDRASGLIDEGTIGEALVMLRGAEKELGAMVAEELQDRLWPGDLEAKDESEAEAEKLPPAPDVAALRARLQELKAAVAELGGEGADADAAGEADSGCDSAGGDGGGGSPAERAELELVSAVFAAVQARREAETRRPQQEGEAAAPQNGPPPAPASGGRRCKKGRKGKKR